MVLLPSPVCPAWLPNLWSGALSVGAPPAPFAQSKQWDPAQRGGPRQSFLPLITNSSSHHP